MKKRFLSLLCVLALCLGLLPVTALAVDAPATLYVGNQQVISGTETTYWSTNNSGELTQSAENNAWNVKYDPNTVTLTLKNATIEGGYNNVNTSGSGIYAASSSGPVSLNIVLEEENKVSGMYGIDVRSSGGDASLNISGFGSLTVSGLSGNGIGIFMSSQNNANLTIEEASVTALGSRDGGSGVRLITSQTGSPSLTIEVKGGSLQASGETNGIHFLSNVNGATAVANMKVSGNAMVKASNIITTKDGTGTAPELKPAASGSDGTGGIIWNGKSGTVYGDVTLQEDITIGEGESLTIGDGASLNTGSHEVIVNGGTLTGGDKIEGTVKYAPAITTESLPEGTVGTAYNQLLGATGSETITWSLASGTLPTGLKLSDDGKITGTPTAAGTSTFTVTATNASGSASKEYTLIIKAVSVTGVTLNKSELSLYTGQSETLTAAVAPDNATNKTVTWSSDNEAVATVDNSGKITAVTAGEANITVKTEDGNHSADCKVTVTQSAYSISADTTALNFGSVYTGYTQPAAQTVTVKNTGNRQVTVTLPTANDFIITAGTGFTNGSAAIEPDGTATFTVQPKAGLSVGTYSENIAVTSSEGATVTISATFTVRQYSGGSSDPTYSITLPSRVTGGELKLSRRYAEKGETVTLTAIPDEGYELDTLTVTDSKGKEIDLTHKGGNEYTFKMPAGRVEIEVSFREIEVELPFTDVPEGAWYADAAAYVYEHGLMAGTSATTFAPDATTSRSMIATILWRMAGSPVVNYAMDYTDVAQGQWYSEAIRWAASEGIVGGYGNGLFGTNDPITREQFAAMLYRFAQEQGYDVSVGEDTNILSYTDVADLSEYAISAMQWAVGAGIINGTGDGSTLTPQGQATRAQAAVMLMRFCEEYVTW